MVKVVPRPAVVAMSIRPPMVSMLVLTTSMPTPRPDTEVTAAAVENPASKMNLATCASVIRPTSAWDTSPRSHRLLADRREVQALAVVGDLDRDRAALVVGGQPDRAAGGLARRHALGSRFEAVIRRVADHVGPAGSLITSRTCRSSSVSAPTMTRSICLPSSPERSRTTRGSFCHALPIGCMRVLIHAVLQLGRDVGQALQRHLVARILVPAGDLQELVAGQHQLRDHRHQVLERVDAHPDGLVLGSPRPSLLRRPRPSRRAPARTPPVRPAPIRSAPIQSVPIQSAAPPSAPRAPRARPRWGRRGGRDRRQGEIGFVRTRGRQEGRLQIVQGHPRRASAPGTPARATPARAAPAQAGAAEPPRPGPPPCAPGRR